MATTQKIHSVDSFEIPRPKCVGMQFVPICGRYGYYQTVNKSVAIKYGLSQQQQRRPTLPDRWSQLSQHKAEEQQRQVPGSCLGKLGKGKPAERSAAEPTPDYDEETGADRISVPNGSAPPAPPLSLFLRQSLPGNQKKGMRSTIRQDLEKRRNSYEKMADGVANALMNSTFQDEHPKKMMAFGNGGPMSAKTVVDVRL